MKYLKDNYGLICICNECERVFNTDEMTLKQFEEQNGYCNECYNEQEEIV